ncbi:hypothetical protein BH10PLA1_BH10PLA1_19280 [soil metagenome]
MPFPRNILVLLILCFSMSVWPAGAIGEPSTKPIEQSSIEHRVASLLKQLDSDSYQDREAAGETVGKLPPEALPLLEAAIKRSDLPAETRNWLQLAIETIRRGAGQQKRLADRLAYNRRTLGDAYDKIGKKDPKWDTQARRGLELAAVYYTRVSILGDTDNRAALASLRAAVTKGCDDPLVAYLAMRFVKESRFQQLYKAAQNLAASDYPAVRKFGAFTIAAEKRYYQLTDDGALPETRKRIVDAVRLIAPMSADKDTPGDIQVDLIGDLMDVFAKAKGDREELFDQVDTELAKNLPEDSLVRLNLKGRYLTSWAWDARGGDWAANVTDEGWKLFAERLDEAQKVLEHAYTLYPDDPTAPTQMIPVEMGHGKGRASMEVWFDRAVKAAPEQLAAYQKKMYYLEPRWHGSEAEQLKFGRECLAAGDFSSRVPLMMVSAYKSVEDTIRFGALVKRPAMHNDEAWADIAAAYDGYLAQNPNADLDYTAYAKLALDAGRWKEADAILKKAGDHLDVASFGGEDVLRLTKIDLAQRLADDGNADLTASESARATAGLRSWRKMLTEDYEKVGRHNGKWDAKVKAGLAALEMGWGGRESRKGNELDEAHAALDQAVAAGCDDPMIKCLATWVTDGEFAVREKGYVNLSLPLYADMVASPYSASLRVMLAEPLVSSEIGRVAWFGPPKAHPNAEGSKRLDELLTMLPQVVKEQLIESRSLAEVTQHIAADYLWIGEPADVLESRIDAALKAAGANDRAIAYFHAKYIYDQSWQLWPEKKQLREAQGKEFKPYLARLDQARQAYEALWQADPGDPTPATQIIMICRNSKRPRDLMEFWFRQALLPAPHNFEAYKNKYEYLAPWAMAVNSDYGDQLSFGRRCFYIDQTTSEIPFIRSMAWINWASWASGGKPSLDEPVGTKIAKSNVWFDISNVYTHYLNAYPVNHKRRSEYAKLACLAERWDVADAQFKALGEHVRVKEFGSQQRLDAFRKQAAELGPTMPKSEKDD